MSWLRNVRLVLVAALWLMCSVGRAEAASGDADGTYTVTVTQVEVSRDGGSTYTTVFSGSQAINIAAVNAGAVAAGLVSGATMQAGTYDSVRVTIGSTLSMKGYVNNTGAGTTLYTDGGADADAFTGVAGLNNTTAGDYGVSTFTIPVVNRTQTTSGLSITIDPGKAPTVSVTFNTSGVLTQSGGTPSVGPPSVTITSQ